MPPFRFQTIDAPRSYPVRAAMLSRAASEATGEEAEPITAALLHERYMGDVFRYVLRRVPRQEEAEDVTAEVFAAATAGLARFRGQCPPRLWLLGIARRQVAIALRRRAVRRETLASELDDQAATIESLGQALAEEGPEAAVTRAELRAVVRQLLAQLGPDQREALLLQYVDGLAIAEIAVVMERSPGAVHSLLHRARETLYRLGRTYFEEQSDHEQTG
jgi:RNA polymerase sigma-70 factor, ECF subfamily